MIPAAIGPAPLPAAIGPAPLLVAPIGFMMTDGTACTCPKETVSNEMPGDAADHRSFYATGCLRRAWQQTDKSQHGACGNEHRLHNHILSSRALAGPGTTTLVKCAPAYFPYVLAIAARGEVRNLLTTGCNRNVG
jgi:hypothetical protein